MLLPIAVFLVRKKSITGLVSFLNITSTVLISFILVQSAVYAFQVRQAVLFLAVTIIDDRGKLQGKSFAKQAVLCFTIVCIAKRAWAVTMKIEH